jgi:hypothetical protein
MSYLVIKFCKRLSNYFQSKKSISCKILKATLRKKSIRRAKKETMQEEAFCDIFIHDKREKDQLYNLICTYISINYLQNIHIFRMRREKAGVDFETIFFQ